MILTEVQKGAEFTYGVHGPSLAELAPDNAATIMHPSIAEECLRQLDGAVMGSVRSLNEKFGLLRQGIAYALPWTRNEAGEIMFLVYCRRKINNEGQLAMKLSLAPGGHIEKDDLEYHYVRPDALGDLVETPIIDHLATLASNLQRELWEEVHFLGEDPKEISSYAARFAQPCGIVNDSQPEHGYVGNIHFGALYLAPIPQRTLFEMKEKHNVAVGWLTAAQLKAARDDGKQLEDGVALFEPWSKLIIDRVDLVEQVINDIWPTAA